MSQPTQTRTVDVLTWTLATVLGKQGIIDNLITTVGNLFQMRSADPISINGVMAFVFDDASTDTNVENTKLVRKARAIGCTCIWGWHDGVDGGTNPFVVMANTSCPAPEHVQPGKK